MAKAATAGNGRRRRRMISRVRAPTRTPFRYPAGGRRCRSALEDQVRVAVVRVAALAEHAVHGTGPAVVGQEREADVAVVLVDQVAEVAEAEAQVRVAVEEVLVGDAGLEPAGGGGHELGEPAGAHVADRAVLEAALDLDEPVGELRFDAGAHGVVVDVGGEAAGDAVPEHGALDGVPAGAFGLELRPAAAHVLLQAASARPGGGAASPFRGRAGFFAGGLHGLAREGGGGADEGQADQRVAEPAGELAAPAGPTAASVLLAEPLPMLAGGGAPAGLSGLTRRALSSFGLAVSKEVLQATHPLPPISPIPPVSPVASFRRAPACLPGVEGGPAAVGVPGAVVEAPVAPGGLTGVRGVGVGSADSVVSVHGSTSGSLSLYRRCTSHARARPVRGVGQGSRQRRRWIVASPRNGPASPVRTTVPSGLRPTPSPWASRSGCSAIPWGSRSGSAIETSTG